MKWMLAGKGFDLEVSHSGEEALDLLHRTDFDVVVTDVEMPGISGLELLDQVRLQWPESEVVIISAHDRTTDALRATRAGAFDYISKPWETKVFIETIQRAADAAQRGAMRKGRGPVLSGACLRISTDLSQTRARHAIAAASVHPCCESAP